MQLAIVHSFTTESKRGTASLHQGGEVRFSYSQGRTFYSDDDSPFPRLSELLQQAGAGHLKLPRTGDPIILFGSGKDLRWGYLGSYLLVAEKLYGTEFVSAA